MKRQEGLKRKIEEQTTPGPSHRQDPSADSDDPLCKRERSKCESGIAESSLDSPSTEFLLSTLDVVQRDKRLNIVDWKNPLPSTSAGSQYLKIDISSHQRFEHFALPSDSDKECNIGSDVSEIDSESSLYGDMKTIHSDYDSYDEEIGEADSSCVGQSFGDEISKQAKIPFSGTTGLRVDCPKSPIEFFRLIANDIFFERIIAGINKYGEDLKSTTTETGGGDQPVKWQPVTREEFEKFIALIFLIGQGQVQDPELNWYWENPSNSIIFSVIMPKNRFKNILSVFDILYFDEDDRADDSSDQVKSLDIFHNNMKNIYYPQKVLTINKSVISLEGRHFRQNADNKPAYKFGVAIYMLTEVNGLILKIHADLRSKEKEINKISPEEIVYKLLSDFEEKGHAIYLNDTFTSYSLVKNLLEKKIHTTGTLKQNGSDNNLAVVNATLKEGMVLHQFSEGICVMQYKDRRKVTCMISSEYSAIMKETTVRGNTVEEPEMFLNYNLVMYGIKKTDKFLMYYPCDYQISGVKWPAKFALHIFHVIMYNSYVLFCHSDKSNMELFVFRNHVLSALIGSTVLNIESVYRINYETRRIHIPIMVRSGEKMRCIVCYLEKGNKDKRVACPECPGTPQMCTKSCFKKYHKY